MTAALVRIIARMHFEGRDGELAELVGETPINRNCEVPKALQTMRGQIDAGRGIGERTIINIMRRRRKLAGDASPEADNDTRGLVAIREAVATLKASGEHDKIIADEASRERVAAEASGYTRRSPFLLSQ